MPSPPMASGTVTEPREAVSHRGGGHGAVLRTGRDETWASVI